MNKMIQTLTIFMLLTLSSFAQSYNKWLAVGDSITQHGPRSDLKWEGPARGMAASSLGNDYVHLLQDLLKKENSANVAELKIVGRLGKLSAGTMEQMETVLGELRDWGADLVTIQLGENDKLVEVGADGFEERYRTLVDGLLIGSSHPRVLCVGVWMPGETMDGNGYYKNGTEGGIKDAIIKKICAEKGLTFVSVAAISAEKDTHGYGGTAGVKWHPNDAGMKGYADAIFNALYPKQNAFYHDERSAH